MKRSPEFSQTPAGQALLDTYKQDTRVVVKNSNGEWKEGRVVQTPQFVKDNVLELNVGFQSGQPEIFKYESGEEPEIIVGEELTRDGIVDANLGGTFEVSDPVVSPTYGHVEYTLKTPSGEVYHNVAQELLMSWKKTLELEKKIADLEQEIHRVREDKKQELHDDRLTMQQQLLEVHKHLPPEVADLQDADRTAVERIKKAVDDIHEAASKAIKEFEKKVEQYEKVPVVGSDKKGDELIAEHATPFVDTKYLPDTQYAMGKESAADKERREIMEKKEHDERKEKWAEIKKQVEEAIKTVQEQVEEEKLLELESLAKGLVDIERDKGSKNFNEANERTKAKENVSRSAVFIGNWKKELATRVADAYKDIFHNFESKTMGEQKELFDAIEARRKELAQKAIQNVDSATSDFVDDPDLQKSYKFKKNVEILHALLDESQKEYVFKEHPVDTQGKEIFDWEKEKAALQSRIMTLKAKFEENNSEALQIPEKKQQYQTLIGLETDMSAHFQMLQSLDTVPDTALPVDNTTNVVQRDIVGLNLARYDYLNTYLSEIRKVEKALQTIDETARKNTEQKQIEDKRTEIENSPEKQEFKGEGIDIPSYELRGMLMERLGGVKSAMELILRGGVTRGKDGKIEVSPDLINQMKGLFGDMPPTGFDTKLRSFGIKNWKKFKTLWDTELAEKSIGLLHESLIQTLERNIAEETKWYEKLWSMKGRLGGAAATNALLLAGSGLGAREIVELLGGGSEAQATGAVVGGSASGTAKWWGFNKFFGSEKAKEKAAKKQQELHDKKRDKLIAQLLKSSFTEVNGIPQPKDGILTGFNTFTYQLAQTIRDTSAGEQSFTDEQGTVTLKGSDLLAFKKSLQGIETRDLDEKVQVKLAWAWAKMKNEGMQLSEYQKEQDKGQKQSGIDKAIANISGRASLSGSVASNIAMTGVMMANPAISSTVGAILLGRMGAGVGEQLYYTSERKEAVTRVEGMMRIVADQTRLLREHKIANPGTAFPELQGLRQNVISLKRILHGTAPAEDMSAVVYRVKTGFYEKDDKEKNIKKGDPRPPEIRIDGETYQVIQSMVYEAEREHIYLEEEKQKAKAEKVLAALKKTGDAVAEQQANRKSGWRRGFKKASYMAAGTLIGAAAGVAMGSAARKIFHIGDAPSESRTSNASASLFAGEHQARALGDLDTSTLDTPPDIHSPEPEKNIDVVSPPEPAPIEVAESPDIVAESFGTDKIAKGEGPLHAINRMTAEHDLGMTKSELHTWKMAELERMGIKYENGKWQWGLTVHEGAEIELYTGTDGEPHLRLIGEEGKTITSHDTYRVPSHAVPEKGSAQDINPKSDTPAQGEKSSPKPGQTKTATVDTKSQNVLDKQQELEKASGKSAGKGQVEKQQARFDKALEEKGGVKEFHGGIRKDGNVMVEFGNGDKQLYPADMLGLSAGENGTLILDIPVDVATPLHSGTVASGGGSGSGSYSVGAKVPEGAKFFVTPDEAMQKTASHIVEQQARDSGGGVVREAEVKSDNLQRGKNVDTASEATSTKEQLVPVSEQGNSQEMIAKIDSGKTFVDGVKKSFQSFKEQLDSPTVHASSDVIDKIKYKLYTHIHETYYAMAERGEVPAELIDQPNNIDAIKAYMLQDKSLDPVVKLYFGEGTPASLDGAAAVHMAKSTSDSVDISPMIKVTMPKGGEYMVGVPEGADSFARDRQGHLVLIKGDDLFAPELDEIDGYPVIRIKGGKTGI